MSQNAVGQDLHNADESTPYPTSFMDAYTETKMLQEQVCLIEVEKLYLFPLLSST